MTRDVDWGALRRRLSVMSPAAARETLADPDRDRALLEERARKLARLAAPSARKEEITLVGFGLGGESWSVEAPFVWDAFHLLQLVPLPGAQAPVTGVSAWRGSVLLVLDVRTVLGVPVAPLANPAHVLVLGERQPSFGVLVDALGEVTRLDKDALAGPAEGVALHGEWILGVTPSAGFALDAARLIRAYG